MQIEEGVNGFFKVSIRTEIKEKSAEQVSGEIPSLPFVDRKVCLRIVLDSVSYDKIHCLEIFFIFLKESYNLILVM